MEPTRRIVKTEWVKITKPTISFTWKLPSFLRKETWKPVKPEIWKPTVWDDEPFPWP